MQRACDPDPAVIEKLYGTAAGNALDITLRSLYARRDHLTVLIAMLETEQSMNATSTQTDTGSAT